MQHPSNLYAANGAAIVLAEKGHFDVSKDIFTQVKLIGFLVNIYTNIFFSCKKDFYWI